MAKKNKTAGKKKSSKNLVTKDAILEALQNEEITVEEASKLLETVRTQLYCKVAPKGGCSVYGLGRFPTTLFAGQWERLLDFGDTIREFLEEHDSELSKKDDNTKASGKKAASKKTEEVEEEDFEEDEDGDEDEE